MAKKKKSTLLTRLFGNRNKVTDFMTEEQLQSPGRLILKNFLHNRLGMTGLIVFLLIFLLVMIGPKFYTLDLSYQDNTQLNVAPGMNMMKIPDGMKHKVADISPGTTYGVGVDTDGKVSWTAPLRAGPRCPAEALPALAWFEHAVDATVRQWRFEPASICTFPPDVERNEDCAGDGVVRRTVPLRMAFVFEFSRSERRGRFSTTASR